MSVRLAAQKTRKAHPGRRYTSSVTNTGMSRMRRVVSQLASPIRSSVADEARFYRETPQAGTGSVWAQALGQVASQIHSALASGGALSSNRHARAGRQPEAYVGVRAEGRSHEARAELNVR